MKIINFKLSNAVIISIIILASFLRLYQLGTIPPGMSDDEAIYIYNAYSISQTGADTAGSFLPLSINVWFPVSPVPVYLIIPFIKTFGLSVFSGRLPFALGGILTVFLVYKIAGILFKNKRLSQISAFVIAVSPWHVYFSRTAYDGVIALFFYLWGTYVFIKYLNSNKFYYSYILFLFAFHSYHPTKIFFLFYILILFFIFKKEILKNKKRLILQVFLVFLIFLSYLLIILNNNYALDRQRVFLWNDMQAAERCVNWEREKSTAPSELEKIFSNKLTYFGRIIKDSYLESFSTQFLFSYGEPGNLKYLYAMKNRGQMYGWELVFLILGILFLFRSNNKRVGLFILLSLLVAPLSAAFNINRSYSVRAIMMIPFLVLFTASGIYQFRLFFNKRPVIFYVLMVIIYGFSVSRFLYEYFYQFPTYASESWLESNKEVSLYIRNNEEKFKNIYISDMPETFLFHYGVYTKADPSLIRNAWLSPYPKVLKNITLFKDCLNSGLENPDKFLPVKTVYFTRKYCYKDYKPVKIIYDKGNPVDIIWKIYQN